jgi:hypothetical protein
MARLNHHVEILESLFVNKKYNKVLEYYKDNGLLSRDEINFYLKKYDIVTNDDENFLIEVEGLSKTKYPKIQELQDELSKNRFIENCLAEIIFGYRKIKTRDLFLFEEDKDEQMNQYKEIL